MDKIIFARPNKDLEYKAIDFKNEFFKNGEKEINGGIYKRSFDYNGNIADVYILKINKKGKIQ